MASVMSTVTVTAIIRNRELPSPVLQWNWIRRRWLTPWTGIAPRPQPTAFPFGRAATLRSGALPFGQLDFGVVCRDPLDVDVADKGRRERVLPLWKETAAVVKAWLKVRPASSAPELFLNARAQAMTRSGFEYILAKHVATATRAAPSIAAKGVSPHDASRIMLSETDQKAAAGSNLPPRTPHNRALRIIAVMRCTA
jgi:integrase